MVSVPMEFPIDYIDNGDGTARPVYANQNSRVRVTFKKIRHLDIRKSLEMNEEVYTDQILLVKRVKGSTNTPTSRVREADKRQYRREWEAFCRGESGEYGNSLSDLYGIKPQDLQYLRVAGIYTIEELSEARDDILEDIDGGLELKQLAHVWIKSRKQEEDQKNAIVIAETYKIRSSELEEENKRLREELSALNKPKKRGRPKKKIH